jgi:hypothetical protein
MAVLAPFADKSAEPVRKLADRVHVSFSKFWDETRGHSYHVIDALEIGDNEIWPDFCSVSKKDAPVGRPVEPPSFGEVIQIPQVGGLHHLYTRKAA